MQKELEQKLEATVKSKLHYKEQWSKAMKEVATLKQREQIIAKEQLKRQQQELEAMRSKYLQSEEQQLLQDQIADLRQQTQRCTYNCIHIKYMYIIYSENVFNVEPLHLKASLSIFKECL